MAHKQFVEFEDLKQHVPPIWSGEEKREPFPLSTQGRRHKVVVLDDDPTGTQTVADIRVITSWDDETLRRNLAADAPAFYILTNSRSLGPEQADALALELGERLARAARETEVTLTIVSRGDSTLRGHFPDEVEALREGLNNGGYVCSGGILLVPAFFEGGRYTLGDVHWVEINGDVIPVGETEFARDPAFGFASSRLPEWVEEKSRGTISKASVRSVDLNTIRHTGPDGVSQALQGLSKGEVAVVNALEFADLEVVAEAFWKLRQEGHDFLVRSAASFVPALAGIRSGRTITREHIEESHQDGKGVLVVVGSHVEVTNQQLAYLLDQPEVVGIELRAEPFRYEANISGELTRVLNETENGLREDRVVVVYTSRDVLTGSDAKEYLNIGQRIASGISHLVAALSVRPKFIVAKGGITSSDIATKGLRCREADVLGQAIPGVPVWRLDGNAKFPQIPYVVFPGNVGAPQDLAEVVSRMGADILGKDAG